MYVSEYFLNWQNLAHHAALTMPNCRVWQQQVSGWVAGLTEAETETGTGNGTELVANDAAAT